MTEIKQSKNGINYISQEIRNSPKIRTVAFLWKIPHRSKDDEEDISLKICRYNKKNNIAGVDIDYEIEDPKKTITLTKDALQNILDFISQNYEPFKRNVTKYIPLDKDINPKSIESIKVFFNHPEIDVLVKYLKDKQILPKTLIDKLTYAEKLEAVKEFEANLNKNLLEYDWQKWFTKNKWIVNSDCIRILDERNINLENIADYLVQAYDGFLDIVEIKRPSLDLAFWGTSTDHNNYYPSTSLIKAIMQSLNYVYEVEKEANSLDFFKRIDTVTTVKPRCTLIYGRSIGWDENQRKAYRLLNASYHNLTILTYDHVLERAKKVLELFKT